MERYQSELGEVVRLEALWSVQFRSSTGEFGAGVVILETGRVFGGDAQYFYLGTYEVQDDTIKAQVDVTHYAGQPFAIFSQRKTVRIELSGPVQQQGMRLTGHVSHQPTLRIEAICVRRAELP